MMYLIVLNLYVQMSHFFVKPYAMLDDNTCWVNHLLNSWFCFNANHICFSKCLLSLLLLKVLQDGATLESANFKLQDDEYLVIVSFYMATSSLSHGDLVFDPRSDLSPGGGDDAEHPMDITMSRVHSASDTCDIYFTYIKVNLLLYTCSLDPFEDAILLDIPSVCMHRYCRSFTEDEEECKCQGSPTPSVREAWKRRKKKPGQASGKPGTSGHCPELPATGTSGHPGASGPAAPKPSESVPTRPCLDLRPEHPAPGPSGRPRNFRPCLHADTRAEACVPFRPSLTPSWT